MLSSDSSARLLANAVAAVAALAVGCRRPAPATPVAPVRIVADQHCWWSVFRTDLPPDTVAVHFVRAFVALGLSDAAWHQVADTTWAQAGPTVLADAHGSGIYAARVVAYRHGDSTHFRHFVGVIAPALGWAPPPFDSANSGSRTIPFCGALGKAAAVHGTAPGNPDGEEKLELWRRIP
jgi:hypothetical protein